MATAAVPAARRFRLPRWLGSAAVTGARWLSPAKPVLANLASVPLFTAGLACISESLFNHSWHVICGLVVTGVCLIVLENAIADEQ